MPQTSCFDNQYFSPEPNATTLSVLVYLHRLLAIVKSFKEKKLKVHGIKESVIGIARQSLALSFQLA